MVKYFGVFFGWIEYEFCKVGFVWCFGVWYVFVVEYFVYWWSVWCWGGWFSWCGGVDVYFYESVVVLVCGIVLVIVDYGGWWDFVEQFGEV